jgi:hypothetical protein
MRALHCHGVSLLKRVSSERSKGPLLCASDHTNVRVT